MTCPGRVQPFDLQAGARSITDDTRRRGLTARGA
jgi:hypothetical protein